MAAVEPPRLLLAAPGTQVLLTGSGAYVAGSRLPAVPSVADTVADLGRCLTERAGLDEARLTTLIDPAGPQELGAALVKAAGRASEALMVYYAGHGLVGADNKLYLATRSTVDLTEGIAEHQALPYATVRRVLAGCRAPLTLIVLDCCFAGRAEGVAGAGGRSLDEVFDASPQGAYLLAAASRDEAAWAPAGNRHTAFTGALIDLLTRGDPAAPRLLTVDDVYRCLARALPARLWDAATGKHLTTLTGHAGAVGGSRSAPTGRAWPPPAGTRPPGSGTWPSSLTRLGLSAPWLGAP
jgi:Caspase domain